MYFLCSDLVTWWWHYQQYKTSPFKSFSGLEWPIITNILYALQWLVGESVQLRKYKIEMRNACLNHTQLQRNFYSQIQFNEKIYQMEESWNYESLNQRSLNSIILISCGTLFHWATLLSQEARIELATLPQEETLCMFSFAIKTFSLLPLK